MSACICSGPFRPCQQPDAAGIFLVSAKNGPDVWNQTQKPRINTIIEELDVRTMERYWPEIYSQKRPFRLIDAMESWPATNKWTPAYFIDLFRGLEFPLRVTDDEGDYTFVNHHKRSMVVSDYISALSNENLEGATRPYFGNVPIFSEGLKDWCASLFQDFQFPNVATDRLGEEVRLWIGGHGQKSTIHNDSNHGFNAQVFGLKRFRLYPPEAYEGLYAVRISDETWVSPVDWEQPDLNVHPRFGDIEGVEVVLNPGEMLYIPAFWWHAARAESIAINLNMWIFTGDIGKWVQ